MASTDTRLLPPVENAGPVVKKTRVVLEPKEFGKYIEELVEEHKKDCQLWFKFGKTSGLTMDGKAFKVRDASAISNQFTKKLRSLTKHYGMAYRHSAKKNRRTTDLPFKTLCRYDPKTVEFVKEASTLDNRLGLFKDLIFVNDEKLRGVTSPNLITRLLTIYFRVRSLHNPDNRQLIRPDALMLKYFSEEIGLALERQHSSEAHVDDAEKFPGQIRFPYVQNMTQALVSHELAKSREEQMFLRDRENILRVYNDMVVAGAYNDELKRQEAENAPPAQKPRSETAERTRVLMDEAKKQWRDRGLDGAQVAGLR